jgi:hypothetical protein
MISYCSTCAVLWTLELSRAACIALLERILNVLQRVRTFERRRLLFHEHHAGRDATGQDQGRNSSRYVRVGLSRSGMAEAKDFSQTLSHLVEA